MSFIKTFQVLLVDQSDRFVFKPLLYELLSGEVDDWEIAPSFTDLLRNTSVQFVKDRVKLLRPLDHLNRIEMREPGRSRSGGLVQLESGIIIEYDWLVLALGAEAKLDVVPGSAEYAFPFSTLEDARKVNSKLRMLERERFGKDSPPIRVAIVGCGYSGVELAATISERLEHRGIIQAISVETAICPNAPPGNREAAFRVRIHIEHILIEYKIYGSLCLSKLCIHISLLIQVFMVSAISFVC
ncbi:alternative NAD(P)H-ubiquinone oxidoreductase C1, chloroplastic/mitochondrial-like [Phoenix dactylifera]|uniref:Alternative NAD(P)H-ubiquinone oxidoreductase C1, chloroplastic/mitochondrial-like n=1 Tax=Phoenix dactylifera TaxID=42345 RepID=A0A8B9A0N2_PHODC|nr:alternative NAD(P)H-ubiquinone oxidoreductase C1, chloroplastic/mitochondrial-like [Phoenix dactylifera]